MEFLEMLSTRVYVREVVLFLTRFPRRSAGMTRLGALSARRHARVFHTSALPVPASWRPLHNRVPNPSELL